MSADGLDAEAKYLDLLMEEYRSLRDESKQASAHTYTSLQFGSAASAVVAAAALSQWRDHDAVVLLAFLLVIPFLSSITMLYWIGEIARIQRLSDYLCAVETRASTIMRQSLRDSPIYRSSAVDDQSGAEDTGGDSIRRGPDPLAWERWLRRIRRERGGNGARGNLAWVYRTRLGLFPAVTFPSLLIGTYYEFGSVDGRNLGFVLPMLAVGVFLGTSMTWLAIEIAADVSAAAGGRGRAALALPRRIFRRVSGPILGIGDWSSGA